MESIKLSIIVVSYNHEAYIAEAIDSILMQEADFTYEVVFADDRSTDGTCDVIRDKTGGIEQKQFLFSTVNRGNTGNVYSALGHCRGDYVIVLEGDDYWHDPQKIQKQVDFLDAHGDYIAVSDRRSEVDRGGEIISTYPMWATTDMDVTLNDFLNLKYYSGIETMFRNVYSECFQDEKFKELYLTDRMIGDMTLCLTLLTMGKVRVLSSIGAIYRTATSGNLSNYNSTRGLFKICEDHIRILLALDHYFGAQMDLRMICADWLFQASAVSKMHFEFSRFADLKRSVPPQWVTYYHTKWLRLAGRYIRIVIRKIRTGVRAAIRH